MPLLLQAPADRCLFAKLCFAIELGDNSIPVRIGAQTVEAGMDTGSVGLRVLSRALKPGNFHTSEQPVQIVYGSGVRLQGVEAQADTALGPVKGTMNFQLVTGIECTQNRPNCPASRDSFEHYGIMGDGIPGQGFSAIIGIKTDSIPLGNPMQALGIRSWIVALPRPGEPGRLGLNPPEQEVSGFVSLPATDRSESAPSGALHGCLQNDATGKRICGFIMLDTGAPGIQVSSPDPLPQQWARNTSASLLFQDAGGQTRATEHFRTDERAHMSRLRFEQKPDAKFTLIRAGVSPYLCFEVLYGGPNRIGLRPRTENANLPRCSVQ